MCIYLGIELSTISLSSTPLYIKHGLVALAHMHDSLHSLAWMMDDGRIKCA